MCTRVYLCVWSFMFMHECTMLHRQWRGQCILFLWVISLLPLYGSQGLNSVVNLCGKHFHLQSHLVSMIAVILNVKQRWLYLPTPTTVDTCPNLETLFWLSVTFLMLWLSYDCKQAVFSSIPRWLTWRLRNWYAVFYWLKQFLSVLQIL